MVSLSHCLSTIQLRSLSPTLQDVLEVYARAPTVTYAVLCSHSFFRVTLVLYGKLTIASLPRPPQNATNHRWAHFHICKELVEVALQYTVFVDFGSSGLSPQALFGYIFIFVLNALAWGMLTRPRTVKLVRGYLSINAVVSVSWWTVRAHKKKHRCIEMIVLVYVLIVSAYLHVVTTCI